MYELTELGRELEPALIELGRWGAHFLGEPRERDAIQPGWFFVSLRATFRPELAGRLRRTYEFRIDGDVFHVVIDRARLTTAQGAVNNPDMVVSTDLETFIALLAQRVEPGTVLDHGAVEIEGDAAELSRFVEVFAWRLESERVARRDRVARS